MQTFNRLQKFLRDEKWGNMLLSMRMNHVVESTLSWLLPRNVE